MRCQSSKKEKNVNKIEIHFCLIPHSFPFKTYSIQYNHRMQAMWSKHASVDMDLNAGVCPKKYAKKLYEDSMVDLDEGNLKTIEGIYLQMCHFQHTHPMLVAWVYTTLYRHYHSAYFQKVCLPTWSREQRHLVHFVMDNLYELLEHLPLHRKE